MSDHVGNGSDTLWTDEISSCNRHREDVLESRLYQIAPNTVAAESDPARMFENVHDTGALVLGLSYHENLLAEHRID